MPLHISPLSQRATKGNLLAWLIDAGLAKNSVGEISLRGRHAIIEVPERGGAELATKLDGTTFLNRGVHVWFTAEEAPEDDRATVHFGRLRDWLELEGQAQSKQLQEAREAAGKSASSTSIRKLVVRTSDIGLGGLHLLTLGRKSSTEPLPPTRLKVGAPIELTPEDTGSKKQDNGFRQRGVVTRTTKTSIEIAVPEPPSAEDDVEVFRIDAAQDETAIRRARTALHLAEHAHGTRLAALRDCLLGRTEPGPSPAASAPAEFLNPDLNDSQRAAISHALNAPEVAIIHGPPGTGKTTTLVELIRQAVRRGDKVLACAPSNLAVDNLVEKLRDHDESVLRLGHPIRILESVRDASLNVMVRQHRDMKLVKKYRADAQVLFRKANSQTRAGIDRRERRALRDEAKSLLDDARSVERGIITDLLRNTNVVCSTNTGLDVAMLGGRRFDLVVIDEACQCTEADAWIPALRADRLVLAGDPCQLPPTILSQDAERAGFAISLPERLIFDTPETADAARLLTVQYRMHEDIMTFSSLQFYEGRLSADPSVAKHLLVDLDAVTEDEQTKCAMHFIDTSGALYDEVRDEDTASTANPDEARLAAKKAADLINLGLTPNKVVIITPYNAQVLAVRNELANRNLEEVEVGTIDGFQGRENEAVIISLVRSNPDGIVGFLSDTRRMNVALTRARRKLILIGDSATITSHKFYAELLDYFGTLDAYHVVWEEEDL